MSKTFELALKINAQLSSGFRSAFAGAEKTLDRLGRSMEELRGVQAKLGRAQQLQSGMAETRKELAAVQREITQLGRASMAGTGGRKIAADFDRAAAKADKLKASLGQQAAELREVKGALSQAGVASRDFGAAQKKAAAEVSKLQQAQARIQGVQAARDANLGKRAELQGRMMGAAAMAMTAAAPVMVAANFEQSMAKVGSVAGLDLAGEEFQKLTAKARELGATTAWSASQSAEGMQYLAMAGFDTNAIMQTMPGMLQLASAGAVDLGSAADIASNVLSGFGMEASEMARLGDVLVNTFTTSNTSLTSLGETMKYVGPVAAAMGVSVEQAAAMAGKLGDAGVQGSMAGTTLRTMLTRMAKLPRPAADAIAYLGVETQDAAGNMRDLPSILADIHKSMAEKGLGTAERGKLMADLFGQEALAGANVLLEQAASGALQEYEQKLKKSGTAAEVARKQQDNLKGALTQLGSATESLAITFGNVLKPSIRWAAETMTKAAGVVQRFSEEHPTLTKVLVLAAGGALTLGAALPALGLGFTFVRGGLLGAKGALESFRGGLALLKKSQQGVAGSCPIGADCAGKVGKLRSSFGGLAGVLPKVGGALRVVGTALVASPIGLVVAGIVAAAVLIWKYWGPIKSFFTGLWEGIREAAAPAIEGVKTALKGLENIPGVSTAIQLLGDLWGWITKIGSKVGGFLDGLFTQETAPSAEAQGLGKKVGTAVVKGIKFAFMNLTPTGLAIQAWGPVTAWFGKVGTSISTAITDLINQAKTALSGVSLAEIGAKMIQSIVDGILGMPGAILNAIKSLVPGSLWGVVSGLFGGGGGGEGAEAHARGGIMTRPHLGLVAEAGPEAIVPLRDRARGIAVLRQAAGPLGVQVVGGDGAALQAAAGASGDVAAHARGGIMSRPHLGLVAEAGPEAIVPLRDRARGISVLRQAAGSLGVQVVGGDGAALQAAAAGVRGAMPTALSLDTAGLAGLGGSGSMASGSLLPPGGLGALAARLPAGGPGSGGPGNGGLGGVTVHINQTVNVSGGDAGAVRQAAQDGLSRGADDLERRIAALQHEAARRAF